MPALIKKNIKMSYLKMKFDLFINYMKKKIFVDEKTV